jgi:hypothetical protein
MKLSNSLINFAGEQNIGVYKMFSDYWNHYLSTQGNTKVEYQKVKEDGTSISFAEKEDLMNAALKKEIARVAGVNFADFPMEAYATNPQVSWASFAVINMLVDMVIPDTIIESIGAYADVKNGAMGDNFAFDIEPRDLFVVSKAGHGQRSTEVHRQFRGQVTVTPEAHELTVGVSLYGMLSGKESLANLVSKASRSIETRMTVDVYSAFATAMAAVSNTATTGLRVAGYSQASLLRICQQVTAWNNNKAMIMGTPLALLNVLPDDANYRYALESDYVRMGYIRQFSGYDIVVMPQVADISTPFGMALSDSYIWVVSPSAQKLIKLCIEGNTIANTTGTFANANLTQQTVLTKYWGVGVATNSVAGVITL